MLSSKTASQPGYRIARTLNPLTLAPVLAGAMRDNLRCKVHLAYCSLHRQTSMNVLERV